MKGLSNGQNSTKLHKKKKHRKKAKKVLHFQRVIEIIFRRFKQRCVDP